MGLVVLISRRSCNSAGLSLYSNFTDFVFIYPHDKNRMYWVPVTGTRSPRFAYRQSLWLADMWHAYRAAGS